MAMLLGVESKVVVCLELFEDTTSPFKVNRNQSVDLLKFESNLKLELI